MRVQKKMLSELKSHTAVYKNRQYAITLITINITKRVTKKKVV